MNNNFVIHKSVLRIVYYLTGLTGQLVLRRVEEALRQEQEILQFQPKEVANAILYLYRRQEIVILLIVLHHAKFLTGLIGAYVIKHVEEGNKRGREVL
jgi:hypothetical protein